MTSSPFIIPRDQFLFQEFLLWAKREKGPSASQQTSRSFLLARHALYHALRALKIAPGHEVLVPSYICAAAVEAIAAFGAVPVFFRIERDCSPDFEDIERRISGRTRALLMVHYFGFVQDLRTALELTARHNLLLIEDCAHVLPGIANGETPGNAGHASVFSWRKFLPALYGAELVLNFGAKLEPLDLRRPSFGFELRTAKAILDGWSLDSKNRLARWLLQLPADVIRAVYRPFSRPGSSPKHEDSAAQAKTCDFDPVLAQSALSRVSQMIWEHSAIETIAAKRRSNYQGLAERLATLSGVHLLFPTLATNPCPLHLPLFFPGVSSAHRCLRQSGIPATAWDGVRPSGALDPCFPDAAFLYENLVFLPVHQNLNDRDLDLILDSVSVLCQRQSKTRAVTSTLHEQEPSSTRSGEKVAAKSLPTENAERKRVLLIAYHFPPLMGSSGLLRSLKYCRYLPQYGWQPTVLTAHSRAYEKLDPSQLGEIPSTVKVIRAFALDSKKHLSLRGRYFGATALPDRWVSWSFGAVAAGLTQILADKTDVIFTTFPIATAVWVGYLLHRMTGVPWVADFRDSMTEDDYPIDPQTRRVFRWLERKAVRHASRLIFTARSTQQMYLQRYSELSPAKCLIISNGYDEEDFRNLSAATIEPGARVRMCHAGLIYPEERDPIPFFQALSRLKKENRVAATGLAVDLRACGHESSYREIVSRLAIDDLVHFLPALPYHEALEDGSRADVSLLMQAACCDHQIPAKAYEYLRLGKPILGLTSCTGDTAALLSECGGATIMDLADHEAIYRSLPDFLQAVRTRKHPLPNMEAVSQYSRQTQAGQLALCLSEVMESKATEAAVSRQSERVDG